MAIWFFLLLLPWVLPPPFSCSTYVALSKGSSLSVDNGNDVLTSPTGAFSAGFFPVGDNAYCFAIWFNETSCSNNCTVVWMANRDQPVNGKRSKLSLLKSGNLIVTDAGLFTVWSTNTVSESSVNLLLHDNGNLALESSEGVIFWQSFDSPTDTLLPQQSLTRDRPLVSSRGRSNYSSGFYKLYFDNDNVLHLLYNGQETSSIYWPDPENMTWEAARSSYNNSRTASLDSLGSFSSSDDFTVISADYGARIQRRLKIDFDGNVRIYSREEGGDNWVVSWQAMSQPCRIHGICGPNSICTYVPSSGRRCSCLPGFKMKDSSDWSLGCEPEFTISCNRRATDFLQLNHLEFWGYDYGFHPNYTFDTCKKLCLQACYCKGFQFKFIKHNYPSNIPYCFLKTQLLNGRLDPSFQGYLYLKVPKNNSLSEEVEEFRLDCSDEAVKQLNRTYSTRHENGSLKTILWFAIVIGVIEFFVIFMLWCFFTRIHQNSLGGQPGHLYLPTGFRQFTHSELKKATQNFSEEIGRGAGGIVYRGTLTDKRVAAIKKLNEANQGEAEFQAEVSTIGKLHHMNLIEMWGYCSEGKHKLLVYEFMENGSLTDNLSSGSLDGEKRFDIAVGTAKALAYLHEECLEWVLHCDVKTQNILLDCNYQPKLSDFGLSRLIKRGSHGNSNFSRIRGTRGYMAPEWIFNQPITSKVDVYSYGMVLLEMVTGKSPTVEIDHRRLVSWVRVNMNGTIESEYSCLENIIDPNLEGKFDEVKMGLVLEVALKCVNEDKDARPTMSQVVKMLLHHENGSAECLDSPPPEEF